MQNQATPILITPLRSSRGILLGCILAAIFVVIGTTLFTASKMRQQAQVRIEVTTQNLVRSIEQNIFEKVESLDVALLNTRDEINRQFSSGTVSPQLVSEFIRQQVQRQPDIPYLRAANEQGDVIYGSGLPQHRVNIADRAYFARLRNDSGAALLDSEVLKGRIEDKWVWLFARRINKADGSFGGVIYGAILIDRLNADFSRYQLDAGGSIALRDGNLGLITRYVVGEKNQLSHGDKQLSQRFSDAISNNSSIGSYVSGETSIDGISRTHSFRRNDKYNFVVNVGMSGDAEIAQWRELVLLDTLLVLAFIVAASAFAWLLLKFWYAHENSLASVIASQQALAESEARYRLLAENISDVIWIYDIPTDQYTYVSPSVQALRGYAPEEIIGRSMAFSLTAESAVMVRAKMKAKIASIRAGENKIANERTEIDQPHRDGHVVHSEVVTTYTIDEQGDPVQIIGVSRDIGERKRLQAQQDEIHQKLETQYQEILRLQEQLLMQVLRDPLTDLHNRRFMDEALLKELARAKREGYPISLIMLDLDFFKRVNDTYGHAVGDVVLISLASFLKANARESDIVCRYGGEEFLVAMPHMSPDQAFEKIDEWRQIIADSPITHGELIIRVTISAGIAGFPEQGSDIDILLKRADEALYQSKKDGRNCVTVIHA